MPEFGFLSLILSGTVASEGGGEMSVVMVQLVTFLMIIPLFYFMIIRPQKKKDKQVQSMRNAVQIGDEIVTIGGIVGIVVNIKEDTFLIETGSDRSKIRVKRWAIQANETMHDTENTEII